MNFRNIFKQNYSEPSGSFFFCVCLRSRDTRYLLHTLQLQTVDTTIQESQSYQPEYVCHYSRAIPISCSFPWGHTQTNQPVDPELGRQTVSKPGHDSAVVHLFQVGVGFFCPTLGLAWRFWDSQPVSLEWSFYWGDKFSCCAARPCLSVQRLQGQCIRPGPVWKEKKKGNGPKTY